VQGFNLDVVGTIPFTDSFSASARAGVQVARTRATFVGTGAVTGFNPNPSKREADYKLGVGLQYAINPSFLIRGDAERYRINDAVGNHGNVNMYSVSLVFPFGRQPMAPTRAMAQPAYIAPASPPPPAPTPVAIVAPAPAAVVPAAPVAPAPPVRRQVSFSAESLFAFDKSTLKPEGKTALDSFAKELSTTKYDMVTVTGHSDRLGTQSYNQRLSERRAEAVKSYLVTADGVAPARIAALGKGESMPVTAAGQCPGTKRTTALVACLQPDRRVDVDVSGTR
jgi:OOP family OmpA-OmpF porin